MAPPVGRAVEPNGWQGPRSARRSRSRRVGARPALPGTPSSTPRGAPARPRRRPRSRCRSRRRVRGLRRPASAVRDERLLDALVGVSGDGLGDAYADLAVHVHQLAPGHATPPTRKRTRSPRAARGDDVAPAERRPIARGQRTSPISTRTTTGMLPASITIGARPPGPSSRPPPRKAHRPRPIARGGRPRRASPDPMAADGGPGARPTEDDRVATSSGQLPGSHASPGARPRLGGHGSASRRRRWKPRRGRSRAGEAAHGPLRGRDGGQDRRARGARAPRTRCRRSAR